MQVDYVDHMGSDLTVVNAARVSFSKRHETWEDEDERLVSYLARHGHWTPFGHPQLTLRIKAPVFVRTQCFKHKVGFTENEVSRRYVDEEPEFFFPVLLFLLSSNLLRPVICQCFPTILFLKVMM